MKECIVCKKRSWSKAPWGNPPLCRQHIDIVLLVHVMNRLGITESDIEHARKMVEAEEAPKP